MLKIKSIRFEFYGYNVDVDADELVKAVKRYYGDLATSCKPMKRQGRTIGYVTRYQMSIPVESLLADIANK